MSKKIDLEKYRSIGHNREGYKTSTEKTVVDARGSNRVEHFSGRVDVDIHPERVKMQTHVKES